MQRRMTRQRETIYRIAKEMFHPSAEEVYEAVDARFPEIGRATVFRNLSVLAEQGLLKKVWFPGETSVRFDTDVADHSHFVCKRCGKIVDLPPERNVAIPALDGAVIDGYSVNFYGFCEACKDKKKKGR